MANYSRTQKRTSFCHKAMWKANFAERFANYIDDTNSDVCDIAEALEVTERTVNRWLEGGAVPIHLNAFCKVLDIDPDYFKC